MGRQTLFVTPFIPLAFQTSCNDKFPTSSLHYACLRKDFLLFVLNPLPGSSAGRLRLWDPSEQSFPGYLLYTIHGFLINFHHLSQVREFPPTKNTNYLNQRKALKHLSSVKQKSSLSFISALFTHSDTHAQTRTDTNTHTHIHTHKHTHEDHWSTQHSALPFGTKCSKDLLLLTPETSFPHPMAKTSHWKLILDYYNYSCCTQALCHLDLILAPTNTARTLKYFVLDMPAEK